MGTMPAATAAADPPLEPPAVWVTRQGLRVGPKRRGSVEGASPISGVLVLPKITRPPRLRRTGDLTIVIDHVVLEEQAAVARHRPFVVSADVLEEVGHAGERAVGQSGGDGAAGLIVQPADHRVEL